MKNKIKGVSNHKVYYDQEVITKNNLTIQKARLVMRRLENGYVPCVFDFHPEIEVIGGLNWHGVIYFLEKEPEVYYKVGGKKIPTEGTFERP